MHQGGRWGLEGLEIRIRIENWGLQIADCRLESGDCRLQIGDWIAQVLREGAGTADVGPILSGVASRDVKMGGLVLGMQGDWGARPRPVQGMHGGQSENGVQGPRGLKPAARCVEPAARCVKPTAGWLVHEGR